MKKPSAWAPIGGIVLIVGLSWIDLSTGRSTWKEIVAALILLVSIGVLGNVIGWIFYWMKPKGETQDKNGEQNPGPSA